MAFVLTDYSYNYKSKTLIVYGESIVTYRGKVAVQKFKELIEKEDVTPQSI